MKIFLDDERNPNDWKNYDNSWIVVKSCDEFKKTVLDAFHNVEEIEVISFDNDLGENEPEGYDCAKWLINYILDEEKSPPQYIYIHSMNPAGSDNIKKIFENFYKHYYN